MSLWGNKDTVYSTGTVTTITDAGVITGNSTVWSEANGVVPGLVITIGAYGSGVIKSVDSTTQLTLVRPSITAGSTLTETYNIDESPVYLPDDTNWEGNEIYGVDGDEVAAANGASGEARLYAPPHSGWVGVTTYVDGHGTLRVKSEVFVAGGITADAEDVKFPQ